MSENRPEPVVPTPPNPPNPAKPDPFTPDRAREARERWDRIESLMPPKLAVRAREAKGLWEALATSHERFVLDDAERRELAQPGVDINDPDVAAAFLVRLESHVQMGEVARS